MTYTNNGKRIIDLAFAVPIMLVFAPLALLIALAVRLDSTGPIIFAQARLGRAGRTFMVYKFRTMTDRPRLSNREIFDKDPELTRVGAVLRRLKLDELPQLLNVVKGDMSLVGPRPGLPSQLDCYSERAHKRLLVRPGLTGLAQVSGNIHLSWPERWEYDARYVEGLRFTLDMKILFLTVAVVVLGEGRFRRVPDA